MADEIIEGAGGAKEATDAHDLRDGRGRPKERIGLVVGAHSQKTVMVAVERRVKNTAYGKYQNRQKKYSVHDLIGCVVGEFVRIRETRPLSKTKRWRVVEKLGRDKASVPMVD